MSCDLLTASLSHVPGGRQELYYYAKCHYLLSQNEPNVGKAIRQLGPSSGISSCSHSSELAYDVLEYITDNWPLDPEGLFLSARVLHSLGRIKNNKKALELALSQFERYITARPLHADAYYHYGRACHDLSVHYIGVSTSLLYFVNRSRRRSPNPFSFG